LNAERRIGALDSGWAVGESHGLEGGAKKKEEPMMLKRFALFAVPFATIAFLGNAEALQAPPNFAGTYRCGPDAKACQWSGATFTVT
jgi:hypothetical protein